MSYFCTCGASLPDKVSVCPNCGAKRDSILCKAPPSPETTAPEPGADKTDNQPPRKKISVFQMIASVFNTLFGGFLIIVPLIYIIKMQEWNQLPSLLLPAIFPLGGILCILSQLSDKRVLSKWMKVVNVILFVIALFLTFVIIAIINVFSNFT